ncbi:MAG: transaldolase [Anaerolineae bacterium]|nr:transaldolase [Anaerolineae bacterium]
MTTIHDLAALGQSIWYDNIRRGILDSGEFQALLDDGILGVTSNPSIFEAAIAKSSDYDSALNDLIESGADVNEIYEALALEDIGRAADMLRPVYDRTGGLDGYVSFEVSPLLANETEQTIVEARRLFKALDRPNIMIKVPATPAGYPAIETLIGEGININVTLIFSMSQYESVTAAYLAGLEKLAAAGGDLSKVASVASFFVSRVDSKIDALLEAKGNTELQGKIAVANSKVVYARFKEIFSGRRWEALAAQGARVQRPLWASTSTKNPAYPDTLYVDTLIGPHTVNTAPPQTVDAILDHSVAALTVEDGLAEAQAQLEALAALGIDLEAATQELQDEGVDKFIQAFESLLASIAAKRDRLMGENA